MKAGQTWLLFLLSAFVSAFAPLSAQPVRIDEGIDLSVSNSRSNLDRGSGIVETSFLLTLSNTGEVPVEPPLHLLVYLHGDYEAGAAGVRNAMGGEGLDPYGTWYIDLSAEVGTALQPGSSILREISYYRPSQVPVHYSIDVYGVVNGNPEILDIPPFQGSVGEPLTLTGINISDPDGDPLTYAWTTSDGQTSTNPEPTFQFNTPGIQEVVLVVEDDRNGTLTTRFTINILPAGDVAAGRTRTLDGIGLPLGSVLIEELFPGRDPANYLSGSTSGFASLGSISGSYLWRFSKPGYLPVWRSAILNSGTVTAVPNPWLTLLDDRPYPISILGTTEIIDNTGSIRLVFGEGSFEQTGETYLTQLNSQSLPYPLPNGWSPLQAFHFSSDSPPVAAGILEAQLNDVTLSGESVVLALFDEENLAWLVVSTTEGNNSSQFSGLVDTTGTYAVLLPDPGPTAPPEAVAGQALPAAAVAALNPAQLVVKGEVTPATVVASTSPQDVTVTGQLSVNAETLPASGFWLSGRIDEIYTLMDGRDVRTPDYDSTVFGYARPATASGGRSVRLPMRPQLLFPPEDLLEARIRMDVFGQNRLEGTILDAAGGILARDGVRVIAPAGSINQVTAAEILSSRLESFASVAPGATPVKAFQLNLSGLGGDLPLQISFEPLAANAHYVLARLVIGGGDFGLQPVQRFTSDELGNLQSAEPADGPSLPGLVQPGQYVLLLVPEALGLLEGVVSGAAGESLEGISIRVEDSPWGGITGPGGTYQMLAPVGDFTLLAYNLETEPLGQSADRFYGRRDRPASG